MSSLKVEQAGDKVKLAGFLDENSDLNRIQPVAGKVTFDFKDVTRVNSCGVRDWVNMLQKLPSTEVLYTECPMVVVKQLNAVPDFSGKAKIDTFYAPYFCEKCDEEDVKLIPTSAVKDGQPPEMKCKTCGSVLGFDAIPNQYFSFLKRSPQG